MKIVISSIILLISLVSLHAQNIDSSNFDDWNTLESEKYVINHPSDWEVNKEGMMGTSFYLFSPVADSVDLFRENINLIMQDISAYNIDLDQFVELSEKQLKTMMQDTEVISSERITGDKAYHQMVFTAAQGIYDLKFQQRTWIVGPYAYILTFTCEESSFDDFVKIGEKVMGTFKIK